MAKLSDVRRGLEILGRTGDHNVDAQHDELFCGGPDPERFNVVEREELKARGWRWDASLDCWAIFT